MGVTATLHVYLYWKLRQGFGGGRWLWLYVGTAIAFNFSPIARYFEVTGNGRFVEIFFALTVTEYVIVGMISSIVVAADILKMLLSLWDKIAKTHAEDFVTPRRNVTFSLFVVFCTVIYAFYEAWDLREVHMVIPARGLPRGVEKRGGLARLRPQREIRRFCHCRKSRILQRNRAIDRIYGAGRPHGPL
jgi:hypothetical protein